MEFERPPLLGPSPGRIRLARLIALGADALQLAFFPFFSEGFISPLDDALDFVVFCALTFLLGWHISFLPALLFESLPMADLAPTWSIAVFIATRSSKPAGFKRSNTTVHTEDEDIRPSPEQITNG